MKLKKSLPLILTVVMLLSMLSLSIYAADGIEGGNNAAMPAVINDEATLRAAIEAVQPGGYIKLSADINLSEDTPYVEIKEMRNTEPIIFDLNGFTLSGSNPVLLPMQQLLPVWQEFCVFTAQTLL